MKIIFRELDFSSYHKAFQVTLTIFNTQSYA